MNSSDILIIFNQHFIELIDFIQELFPDDEKIIMAKTKILKLKKVNPKLIIRIWKIHIVNKYKNEIIEGNIDFFINKNYDEDVENLDTDNIIIETIDKMRTPVKMMSRENQNKILNYLRNLCNLSENYK